MIAALLLADTIKNKLVFDTGFLVDADCQARFGLANQAQAIDI